MRELGLRLFYLLLFLAMMSTLGRAALSVRSGFGFEMTIDGAIKMPHLGLPVIHDQVSVGSNCAID